MTVNEAALKLGKSRAFVRLGLQHGRLPIGTAVKMSSVWTYYISEAKLNAFIGGDSNDSKPE